MLATEGAEELVGADSGAVADYLGYSELLKESGLPPVSQTGETEDVLLQ